jgi:hypothetical protein
MKKLLTMVLMAAAFVTASAISAFCANVAGEVSGLSRRPLSGVQLSLTNSSIQVFAQAGADSGYRVRDPESDTHALVSDGLLKPGGGAEDRQANNDNKSDRDKDRDEDKDHHEGRCKHGEHERNKHCVPSGSE